MRLSLLNKKVMASIGKKFVNKQYWANESSDDDDDDDSDLVVDEDVAVGAPPPADDAPPQLQEGNKKKRKRVSENVKRYNKDLHALADNLIANPDDKDTLIVEFVEEHPPAKKKDVAKRRTRSQRSTMPTRCFARTIRMKSRTSPTMNE